MVDLCATSCWETEEGSGEPEARDGEGIWPPTFEALCGVINALTLFPFMALKMLRYNFALF